MYDRLQVRSVEIGTIEKSGHENLQEETEVKVLNAHTKH